VQLILVNDDAMPHNLVITAPGTVERMGTIAEKMQPDLDYDGRFVCAGRARK